MQAKKVSQFLSARDAYASGSIRSKRKAIEKSGLSATTYYKYEKEFGELPVGQPKQVLAKSNEKSIIDTHYNADDKTLRDLVKENAKLKDLVIQKLLNEMQ